jgi:hypothetical protein
VHLKLEHNSHCTPFGDDWNLSDDCETREQGRSASSAQVTPIREARRKFGVKALTVTYASQSFLPLMTKVAATPASVYMCSAVPPVDHHTSPASCILRKPQNSALIHWTQRPLSLSSRYTTTPTFNHIIQLQDGVESIRYGPPRLAGMCTLERP